MKFNLRSFEKEVKRLDPTLDPEDTVFKTSVLMLSALKVGANADRVAQYCHYSRRFVRERAKRLREGGIWVRGETHCDWGNKKSGVISFWCDVLVAEGLLNLSWIKFWRIAQSGGALPLITERSAVQSRLRQPKF